MLNHNIGYRLGIIKSHTRTAAIAFIIGWLIVPSPVALVFPQPIRNALQNVSCSTNSVYKAFGLE